MESRDRRPMRPAPGDRGAWSHAPVGRVLTRPLPGSGAAPSAPPAAPPAAPAAAPSQTAPAQLDRAASAAPPAWPRYALPVPFRSRPAPVARTHLTSALALRPMGGPSARGTGGVYGAASRDPGAPPSPRPFGLASLRRNVCPHFYLTGSRGAIPIQAPHLLKSLIRQPANVSRCQLRGGVHLDEGYVNDVCLTPRFNQCVFYEDELSRE